jgi:ribokinase
MICSAGMVLAQLEIPLETVEHLARLCAHENVPLMLDPAPAAELPKRILQDIAWFTPNETETAFYIDNVEASPSTAAQKLLSNGCKGIVLKMGSQGVYLKSQDGIDEHVPAFSVKAVDTTAAGDAFNAGFATGLMRGKSPVDAAAFASAVAAISVTRSGAQPSMPTMAEVEAFLKSNSQYVERQLADK